MSDSEWVQVEVGFDAAVDEATHAVAVVFEHYIGRRLEIEKLYRINDALTALLSEFRGGVWDSTDG